MEGLFKEKHIYTVTEITKDIREILSDSFANVWIKGEISTLRIPQSGHMYFTLKDKNAQLKCVFFKGANANLKFKMEEGMECVLFGRISVYDQSGQYQLYVQRVEPIGKGALQEAFEQLKKKLAKAGLFDQERKRPIPFLPKKIGIVTSATGAAIRDILNIIERRYADVNIIIRPSLVQGKTAALDIANGIKDLNNYKDIDVIIVTRGGGSLEDLWAFNEEAVAKAVYKSKIPVISAVGHEIDFTICDFVADLRVPTPSAAAELVVQEKNKLIDTLNALQSRITEAILQKIRISGMRFEKFAKSYAMRRPQVILERYQQDIDNIQMLISTRFDNKIKEKSSLLKQISARLVNLNPLAILSRGYSVTYLSEKDKALKNIKNLKKGDILKTKLHKGVIISQIKETLS